MSNNRAYMRKYMLKRYHNRRNKALEQLGNKCKCGAVDDLEFDHIDPRDKKFTIAKLSSINEKDFWVEIQKCQILCKACHEIKTLQDLEQVSAKTSHGTLSSYRYCKCELCREANSEYQKNYKRLRKI